jgi:pyruvate/2-oxoglutarate dehydrogenase complex dihydrolipoamide dehydrogenase (E3) component
MPFITKFKKWILSAEIIHHYILRNISFINPNFFNKIVSYISKLLSKNYSKYNKYNLKTKSCMLDSIPVWETKNDEIELLLANDIIQIIDIKKIKLIDNKMYLNSVDNLNNHIQNNHIQIDNIIIATGFRRREQIDGEFTDDISSADVIGNNIQDMYDYVQKYVE